MSLYTFEIPDIAALDRLAKILAENLPAGTVVALNGTLGAGKTRLVQGIAEACGVVDEEVISPTFVLCREYHGKRTIYHADAYRVRDEDEFLALGAEEWFQSSALTFIEWAEKIVRCLPADYLVIELLVTGETSRRALLHVVGVELKSCLQQIVERYTS